MSLVDETGLSERLQRAADPATPSWHLAELADNADPEIRMAVAANPSASELTLLRLQRDPDPAVRSAVRKRFGVAPRGLQSDRAGSRHPDSYASG